MVDELEHVKRFRAHLRSEDKEIFDDLLNQCRLYASYAGTMASPVRDVPLFMSMLFAAAQANHGTREEGQRSEKRGMPTYRN